MAARAPTDLTWILPHSLADLSQKLHTANETQTRLRVARRSTSSDQTHAHGPRVDALLSLDAVRSPIEHFAGDLVATVPAGATLAEVNAHLARGGQWLPVDPPDPDMTIGALVAMNASGPRRHRFGTPRDLIIGIEMVLADGRIARAGGRVVKNVAGYDLARLMCGAYGSLAVITRATFKLTPLPAASRTVIVEAPDARTIHLAVAAIGNAPLTPSTVELQAAPWRLLVRFESTAGAAERQAEALSTMCARQGASCTVISDQKETDAWTVGRDRIWRHEGTLVRVGVLPTDVPMFLEMLTRHCGADWRAAGRIALGVLDVKLLTLAAGRAGIITELREWAISRSGSVVVVDSDADLGTLDRWGEIGDALPLMRAIKARFDPHGILNPGGGPCGL